jgi:hypothetical protein
VAEHPRQRDLGHADAASGGDFLDGVDDGSSRGESKDLTTSSTVERWDCSPRGAPGSAGRFGEIAPVSVSEGGLDPRSWWYIPKRGIHHQSKLTRQGSAEPAFRRRKEAAAPARPTSPGAWLRRRRGGQPEWDRRPGPDCGSRLARLHHQGSAVTASRCCPAVPAPQPQPRKPAQMAGLVGEDQAVAVLAECGEDVRGDLPGALLNGRGVSFAILTPGRWDEAASYTEYMGSPSPGTRCATRTSRSTGNGTVSCFLPVRRRQCVPHLLHDGPRQRSGAQVLSSAGHDTLRSGRGVADQPGRLARGARLVLVLALGRGRERRLGCGQPPRCRSASAPARPQPRPPAGTVTTTEATSAGPTGP